MSTPNEPRQRAPRGIALGFIVAFVLSTATIIYTGLKVGAPQRASRAASEAAEALPRGMPNEAEANDQAKARLDGHSGVPAPDAGTDTSGEPPQ